MLATGITAAARVLAVLADTAMARRHVAALLAVSLETCTQKRVETAAAVGRRPAAHAAAALAGRSAALGASYHRCQRAEEHRGSLRALPAPPHMPRRAL